MVTGFGNLDCLVLGDFEDARRVQDVTGNFRVREMDNALPPNQRGCLWVRLPNLHPGSKNAVALFRHSASSPPQPGSPPDCPSRAARQTLTWRTCPLPADPPRR